MDLFLKLKKIIVSSSTDEVSRSMKKENLETVQPMLMNSCTEHMNNFIEQTKGVGWTFGVTTECRASSDHLFFICQNLLKNKE